MNEPFSDGHDEPENPVFCCDCDGRSELTQREPEHRWLCAFAPRNPRKAYTSPGALRDAPYHYCREINSDGLCGMFIPRRMPKERG